MSTALFCAQHVTRCWPTPCTGIPSLAPRCHWYGLPSTEQAIATPLGPAVAAAAMYCVPAVDRASVRPDSRSVTGALSTSTVFAGAEVTPAAFVAPNCSGTPPFGYLVVSSSAASCEPWHCVKLLRSRAGSIYGGTSHPPSTAIEMAHTPDASPTPTLAGQLPRTQPG